MGLGKTIQAISVMEKGKQVLVICPAMLRTTWQQELKKFTNLSSKVVDSRFDYESVYDVIISSYANVKNIPVDLLPAYVVMDECHYIKNVDSQRAKSVHKYIQAVKPEHLVGLSGTPITKNVTEIYSMLKLLSMCPSGTNGLPVGVKSQTAFNYRFSHQKTRRITVNGRQGARSVQVTEFSGVKNKDILITLLRGKYLRRLASKVLDLPPIVDKEVILSTKKSKKDEVLLDMFEFGTPIDEHITRKKIDSALSKVSSTAKYVKDIVDCGESVVVFSDHIEPIDELHKTLKEMRISSAKVHGGVKKFMRQSNIDDFKDNKFKVLICSFKAASVGLTLTTSRQMVFNDLSWIPADIEQARKRIHRISQERSCTITYMLNGDFDIRIKRKLDSKRKDIRQIISEDK